MTPSSLPPTGVTTTAESFAVGTSQPATEVFSDRRASRTGDASSERRQFGSSHAGLSPAGHELAVAIDQYKIQNHRRYITCDEMLAVLQSLGYSRS